ncbi:hypothetical protein ACGF5F_01610 [Streptomyces sp. NPDC047821]|uniref:hypothetical protein n=1 Tax=Streptomyces sp. NPDC047821 TaxID=3365488 RepID=UPI00371AAE67
MSTPGPYQQNPYQQSPYQQNPYAAQEPAVVLTQPPVPPGPPATGGRGPVAGWLWALGGVAVASAVWAGALFATGTIGGPDADFAGHRYREDLCAPVSLDAFRKRYEVEKGEGGDNSYGSRQKGLDQSYCSRSLKDPRAGEDSLASVYVSARAEWHKASDPAGEFASRQLAYEDQSEADYGYEVEAVKGFGDEAYVVTERRGTDKGGLDGMTLSVRDGWFTFELRWSWFGGGPDDKAVPPTEQEVRAMLEADTRAALDGLKE